MRNREKWEPSKFVYRKGRLIASRDRKEVGVSSRLITDLVANFYDNNLKKFARGKLLDLGCGKVPLYESYKNHVTDNICVDWENSLHKNNYVDFKCDITKSLPFPEMEFDTIVLSDVLEHIPEPEILWKEMFRLLTPGGRVIMNVPFYYWLHEHPHDYYRYTEYALRRFVKISGMRLLYLDSIGGAPEVLTDVFAKNCIRLPVIGRKLAIFSQWLTLFFIRTRYGKRFSDTTKKNFPLGYFLVAEKYS